MNAVRRSETAMRVIASIATPVIVQSVLFLLVKYGEGRLEHAPWPAAHVVVFVVSLLAGFAWLVRPFRPAIIWIALVYLPVMLMVIGYWSVYLACGVYGDCP